MLTVVSLILALCLAGIAKSNNKTIIVRPSAPNVTIAGQTNAGVISISICAQDWT